MDYSVIEASLCVCGVCESLVPIEEAPSGDCYACVSLAASVIELRQDLEVVG